MQNESTDFYVKLLDIFINKTNNKNIKNPITYHDRENYNLFFNHFNYRLLSIAFKELKEDDPAIYDNTVSDKSYFCEIYKKLITININNILKHKDINLSSNEQKIMHSIIDRTIMDNIRSEYNGSYYYLERSKTNLLYDSFSNNSNYFMNEIFNLIGNENYFKVLSDAFKDSEDNLLSVLEESIKNNNLNLKELNSTTFISDFIRLNNNNRNELSKVNTLDNDNISYLQQDGLKLNPIEIPRICSQLIFDKRYNDLSILIKNNLIHINNPFTETIDPFDENINIKNKNIISFIVDDNTIQHNQKAVDDIVIFFVNHGIKLDLAYEEGKTVLSYFNNNVLEKINNKSILETYDELFEKIQDEFQDSFDNEHNNALEYFPLNFNSDKVFDILYDNHKHHILTDVGKIESLIRKCAYLKQKDILVMDNPSQYKPSDFNDDIDRVIKIINDFSNKISDEFIVKLIEDTQPYNFLKPLAVHLEQKIIRENIDEKLELKKPIKRI